MCNCCCCPQPTRCTRFQVTFTSIEVSDIDDGFFGGSLETTWTFVVNGQVQILTLNSLDTGVRTLGVTFFADVPTDSSAIVIQAGGKEHDLFDNDDLPGFTHVWGLAQNFGQGVQFGPGSNSSITYRMSYTITCAQPVTVAITREKLIAYAQDKAKTRKGVKEPMSPATLLSWSLDRLCRANWDLVQATDHELIFKGYGSLPRLLEQKYERGQGGEPKKAAE